MPEHDWEAVICGPREKRLFGLLANVRVTCYNGSGRDVQKACGYVVRCHLPWIDPCIGGAGKGGHGHEETILP